MYIQRMCKFPRIAKFELIEGINSTTLVKYIPDTQYLHMPVSGHILSYMGICKFSICANFLELQNLNWLKESTQLCR